MVWSSTILGRTVAGNKRIHYGIWDGAGVTGGDIDTGLTVCEVLIPGHTGSAVEAAVAVANETFPLAGGAVTIVCTSGDAGTWIAIGH